MTPTNSIAVEPLTSDAIRGLLAEKGPCISLTLPAYRPGERAKPSSVVLKAQLQEAERLLAERGVDASVVAELAAPLHSLANDPVQLGGSHWGHAIFRSPAVLRQFRLTQVVNASVNVGNCFAVRSALSELSLPPVFYVLMLANNRVGLLRCGAAGVAQMELPYQMPATLRDFLQLEQPDHDLENRSSSGPDTGAMHGVRFATGTGRETEHAHLADFYKAVDRGMIKFLGGEALPLLLSGVGEDTAIYRSVSEYPGLLPGSLHGSGEAVLQEADVLHDGFGHHPRGGG